MSTQPMAPNGDSDRVAEIRQRLEAATPGEWRHCSGMVRSTGRALDMPTEQHSVAAFANGAEIGRKVAITDGVANSALIAAAPDDIAWLLSRLAVVEAERDELRAEVAQAAIDTVARGLLSDAAGKAEWENYPEIGEYDWRAVLDRLADLAPLPEDFLEAYDLLERRALSGTTEGPS